MSIFAYRTLNKEKRMSRRIKRLSRTLMILFVLAALGLAFILASLDPYQTYSVMTIWLVMSTAGGISCIVSRFVSLRTIREYLEHNAQAYLINSTLVSDLKAKHKDALLTVGGTLIVIASVMFFFVRAKASMSTESLYLIALMWMLVSLYTCSMCCYLAIEGDLKRHLRKINHKPLNAAA